MASWAGQENKDAGPKHVITFCADMDNMLGGGVAMGEVTEFCGAPGELSHTAHTGPFVLSVGFLNQT